jgi:putative Ca2+/H+ antiporter (TMEM165/GDT1 family)
MDLKLLVSTFGLVFLAELGDKTQLATLSLAASGTSRLAVFLGAAGALLVTTTIAVLVGGTVARLVPEVWIQRVAGVGFIIMGVLFLVGKS